MDPIQALIDADQFVSDLKYVAALECLQAYAEWRFMGGGSPCSQAMLDRGANKAKGDREFTRLMSRITFNLQQAGQE